MSALPVKRPLLASMATISLNFVKAEGEDRKHHVPKGPNRPKGVYGTYRNPWPSYIDVLGRMPNPIFMLKEINWREYFTAGVPPTQVRPDFAPSDKLTGWWLAHASSLIEFATPPGSRRGLRVLCDPIWSTRCSPSKWFGPKRFSESPITDDCPLPEVDVVVLSHNHYDHTDIPTLKRICQSQPVGSVQFCVPLGNAATLIKEAHIPAAQIQEFDWWDQATVTIDKAEVQASVVVHATPSQHTCNRSLWDRNEALWAAWAFESGGKKCYFGGDSGYCSLPTDGSAYGKEDLPVCPAFKEAGDRIGPFDLSFIPIGAWSPAKVFSSVHMEPADSIRVHQDLRSKKSIAIHHSTWRLTDEPVHQPREQLADLVRQHSFAEGEFVDIAIGSRVDV